MEATTSQTDPSKGEMERSRGDSCSRVPDGTPTDPRLLFSSSQRLLLSREGAISAALREKQKRWIKPSRSVPPGRVDTAYVKSRIASPIVVFACLAIVLPGCGGATPTDEQAVTDTVNAYHSAALAGDGRTACSYLTPAAQRLAAGRDLSGSPSASCARAIAHLDRDPRLSVNKDLSVTRVTVHGRKARANGESQSKAAVNFVDFELVKKGGQWKITYIFSSS
jgi:hypothetical protein